MLQLLTGVLPPLRSLPSRTFPCIQALAEPRLIRGAHTVSRADRRLPDIRRPDSTAGRFRRIRADSVLMATKGG